MAQIPEMLILLYPMEKDGKWEEIKSF